MTREPNDYWRRRIAAMRVIHVWTLSGAVAAVCTVVGVGYKFTILREGAGNLFVGATRFALGITLLIAAAAFVGSVLRRWIFIRSYRTHIGSPVILTKFPALSTLPAEIGKALGRSNTDIQIRTIIDLKAAPAQVFEGPDKIIYLLLRYDFLMIAKRGPSLLKAILWHELGHYVQWDTKFGYWSLHAFEWLGVGTVGLICVLLIDTGSTMLVRINSAHTTKLATFGTVLQLESVALILFAFLFVRHCRRFSEYNADLIAALAGHGQALADYFSSPAFSQRKMLSFLAIHPTAKARVKAIRRFLKELSSTQAVQLSLVKQNANGKAATGVVLPPGAIHFRHYFYGICVHLFGRWLIVYIPVVVIYITITMLSLSPLLDDPHYQGIITEYFEVVGLLPPGSNHMYHGIQLGNEGKWDAAIAEERNAILLNRKLAKAHDALGWALGHKGEWDAAIAQEREAIRLDPKLAEAHDDLARALGAKGDWNAAITEEREAIRLDSTLTSAHRYLGWALCRMGNWDAAVTEEREAIRLDPKLVAPHEDLGWALGNQGDWETASVEEREAVRLNPESARAHWMLGFCFAKNGDRASANNEYWKACQLEPSTYSCPAQSKERQ